MLGKFLIVLSGYSVVFRISMELAVMSSCQPTGDQCSPGAVARYAELQLG